MSTRLNSIPALPWSGTFGVVSRARAQAGVEAYAAGLLVVQRPAADEMIANEGIDEASLRAWVQGGSTQDRVFAAALEHGSSQGLAVETGLRPSGRASRGEQQILWVCVPESLDGRLKWCACFVRGGEPFSPDEREALEAVVRCWKARFNNPDEPGLSYMLVGEDSRLIHMDPVCGLSLLRAEQSAAALIAELRVLRDQRWPVPEEGRVCDVALTIGDEARWVCTRTLSAWPSGGSAHTLVELRPLEDGELPVVGTIGDQRVAEALGYLHDHFNESPTLTDLAKVVDVSPFHFHRVFTRHVGVSPKQYQLLKQLQVARWRLRCGRESIGRIARDVGFANHAHFTSTFRRILGVSPSEFQRRFEQNPEGG